MTDIQCMNEMNQAGEAISAQTRVHDLCLFVRRENKAEVLGTGLFGSYKKKLFIVSARHVLWVQEDILVYVGDGVPAQLLPRCVARTRAVGGEDDRTEALDLGVIRLPDDFRVEGKCPYVMDDCSVSPADTYEYIMVQGFPCGAAIDRIDGGIDFYLSPFTTWEVFPRWAPWHPYTRFDHISLGYDRENVRMADGRLIDARTLNPVGRSGAPIWGAQRELHANPGAINWYPKFMGIVHTCSEQHNCLIGTRTATLLNRELGLFE